MGEASSGRGPGEGPVQDVAEVPPAPADEEALRPDPPRVGIPAKVLRNELGMTKDDLQSWVRYATWAGFMDVVVVEGVPMLLLDPEVAGTLRLAREPDGVWRYQPIPGVPPELQIPEQRRNKRRRRSRKRVDPEL